MISTLSNSNQRQGFATRIPYYKWLILTACLWLITSAVQASQWHLHKDIYQAIDQFSQQALGGRALTTRLDERSRYPLCISPLQVSLAFNNQKTIKVFCDKTSIINKPTWLLYLSISIQTDIKAWRLVNNIGQQGIIDANDVVLSLYTGHNNSFIGSDIDPTGKQVKRDLNAGHWLSMGDLSDLQHLWRAAKDIPPGQMIEPHHLVASQEPSHTSSINAVSNKHTLLGQLAKRYIKAGKLLNKNDIEGQQYVVISNLALPMGRTLIAEDITMAWVPDHKLRKASFKKTNTLVGWVTKRHIQSNTALTKDMVRKAYLVLKNSQVRLEINLDNYQITNHAQALSNGNLGDEIDVKLTPSGMIKRGVVTEKGKVELLQ